MTDFDIGKGKTIGTYAAVICVVYLVIGVIEIFGGAGDIIPGDLFGGIALVVIGATFLNGIKNTFDGDHKGLSFLIGGLFLSAVFGIVYLLLMSADGLMFLLGEVDEFSVLANFRPAIWMFILSLPLAYLARGLTKDVTW